MNLLELARKFFISLVLFLLFIVLVALLFDKQGFALKMLERTFWVILITTLLYNLNK